MTAARKPGRAPVLVTRLDGQQRMRITESVLLRLLSPVGPAAPVQITAPATTPAGGGSSSGAGS